MSYAKKNWDKVIEVFRCGNEKLGVFFSCGDIYDVMISKKAWNLSTMRPSFELLGVFWLTYFGPQYCEYFTREKLHNIAGASDGPAGGITLQLADVPEELIREDRAAVENAIGSGTFAGEKFTVFKAKGQYVLTLEQLRGEKE